MGMNMKRSLSFLLLLSIIAPLAGCVVRTSPNNGGYYRSTARTAPIRDHRR